MAGIVGQGNTYNLPNYVGELFQVTPTDTPFTSAIGGLTGGKQAKSQLFTWQGVDLRPAGQNVALEGANAPQPQERVRFPVQNVVEIHHEAVEVSYTKQAAVGQVSPQGVLGNQPIQDEFGFQAMLSLEQTARDIEYSFINGVGGTLPDDNTTPRRTQGILAATQTNVVHAGAQIGAAEAVSASGDTVTVTAHGLTAGTVVSLSNVVDAEPLVEGDYYVTSPTTNAFKLAATPGGAAIDITADGTVDVANTTAITPDLVDGLLQSVFDNGGLQNAEAGTLMTGSAGKRGLSKAYMTAGNYREQSRNVGGVNLTVIETDFGALTIMLNRYMPAGVLEVVSLDQCAPVFLEIPGKGFLFMEPLAKVSSSERAQLYGEVGLEYGNERCHGKIDGLAA